MALERVDVLVIGAGVWGVACAWECLGRGLDVLVAEAEAFDRAALDEGHRLDRLVGRARQDRGLDVAP